MLNRSVSGGHWSTRAACGPLGAFPRDGGGRAVLEPHTPLGKTIDYLLGEWAGRCSISKTIREPGTRYGAVLRELVITMILKHRRPSSNSLDSILWNIQYSPSSNVSILSREIQNKKCFHQLFRILKMPRTSLSPLYGMVKLVIIHTLFHDHW